MAFRTLPATLTLFAKQVCQGSAGSFHTGCKPALPALDPFLLQDSSSGRCGNTGRAAASSGWIHLERWESTNARTKKNR